VNNSDNLLAHISRGRHDDAIVSAALDALREDGTDLLLSAVLAVAKSWNDGLDARETASAAKMLRPGPPLRPTLMSVIATECPGADEDRSAVVSVVSGNVRPYLLAGPITPAPRGRPNQHIAVGALWIIERGDQVRRRQKKAREMIRKAQSK